MKLKSILALILIVLVFSSYSAFADLGPKPSMEFNLLYETNNAGALLGGVQLQCENKGCITQKPLGFVGPQGFGCGKNKCSSQAYNYAPYQKLVLNFSDKVRESNVFATETFNAVFNVRVTDSALVVSETTPLLSRGRVPSFILASIITLIIEFLVAFLFVIITKIRKRILVSVLIANFISLPIVWFLFPSIKIYFLSFMLSEVFALVFETYFVYLTNKEFISLGKSFLLSFLMNIASLIVGGFALFLQALIY